MAFTFTTSEGAAFLAGNNAVSNAITASQYDKLSGEAEHQVNILAGYDVISNYSSLTSEGKLVLQTLGEAIMATRIIEKEQGAIGLGEAALRHNFLENLIDKFTGYIKDGKIKSFLKITGTGAPS